MMLINLNDFNSGFAWDALYYFDFSIDSSLDALRKLNGNQEKSLDDSKQILDGKIKHIEEYNKNLLAQDLEAFIHHLHYDEEVVISELQRLQRYSLVVSVFSFLESQLKSICDMIDKEFKYKIKVKDLSSPRGDLMRYWIYLSKVYEMETSTIKKSYDSLSTQKTLRNIITHSDGYTGLDSLKRLPKLSGIEFQEVGDRFLLVIEQDIYINGLLNEIKQFFIQLIKVIDNRYNELKN